MTDHMPVGQFLKSKLSNMAVWITDEVGKENMVFDLQKTIAELSPLEATVLAEVLSTHSTKITHRDWSGLIRVLNEEKLNVDLSAVVQAVRVRPSMHDKFWRYLEMFRDVIKFQ